MAPRETHRPGLRRAGVRAAPHGYLDKVAALICDCGQHLAWLVCERRASPTLARQLWCCTSCERFRWHLEHPPWPDGLFVGMFAVASSREFLRKQQVEIARNAYSA